MYTKVTGLLLILLLLLSGLPLAAQEVALLQKAEVMFVRPGEAAPAFACAEEDCERLAWLPAGARVWIIGQVEGRELEGSPQWYDVLLDCPCFDYEISNLTAVPSLGLDSQPWHLWHPYLSPDGSRIATVNAVFLYIWDAASGERLLKKMLEPFNLYHMAWSPDGAHIVAGGHTHDTPERNLLVLDADGQSLAPLEGQVGEVWGMAWSPDGTRIVSVGNELRIWDVQQGTSLVTVESSAPSVDWSPDGTRFVTGGYGEGLQVRDSTSGELLSALDGGDVGTIQDVEWSPDGTRIAYASVHENSGSAIRVWDVTSQDHPEPLIESTDWISDVSWSPDSSFLVSGVEGVVLILDPDDGRALAGLTKRGDFDRWIHLGPVDWSPEGNRIAATGFSIPPTNDERLVSMLALVWDLTLIPEGQTRAFIHSSQLIPDAAADG